MKRTFIGTYSFSFHFFHGARSYYVVAFDHGGNSLALHRLAAKVSLHKLKNPSLPHKDKVIASQTALKRIYDGLELSSEVGACAVSHQFKVQNLETRSFHIIVLCLNHVTCRTCNYILHLTKNFHGKNEKAFAG